MLAPLSWIKDFVDVDCTPEELEKKLFDCGFEVEQIIPYGDKIDKVVTCKIIKIERHPDAERLRVCSVNAGKYGVLQIVTNAVNVKEGDIVPVAVDGATLATGDRIFNGKLRGVESNGMFCGGEEIGIDDAWYEGASGDSVLIFHDEFPLGEEVRELLALRDYVFDISVLANRPDCQSIIGISREIACALGKPFKEPDLSYHAIKEAGDEPVRVTVEDKVLCPRYIAHLVKDVKIARSPLYMSRRLALCGLNSINNVVDITNYVLLETGQPMHAFDMNDLKEKHIVVRRAENGEKINAKSLFYSALRTPAFIGTVLGIIAGLTRMITRLLDSPFGNCYLSVENILTMAITPIILIVVGYSMELAPELIRPCLKTILLRVLLQAVMIAGVLMAVKYLAGGSRLLNLAVITYMSSPATFSMQTFLRKKESSAYASTTNSLYCVVSILVYIALAVAG